MKVMENVQSTVMPPNSGIEYDQNHVYLYSDVKEVPESERPVGAEEQDVKVPLYSYTVKEYEKDEFLSALANGQVQLDTRATAMEDMILEMSEVVYA